jgi:hypothetical protein
LLLFFRKEGLPLLDPYLQLGQINHMSTSAHHTQQQSRAIGVAEGKLRVGVLR